MLSQSVEAQCSPNPGIMPQGPGEGTCALGACETFGSGVKVRPATSPAGELEVRLDGCDSPVALSISLAEAARSDGVTVLRGRLPAAGGRHDLCLTFTQHGIDPMWGVDWVRLTPAGVN